MNLPAQTCLTIFDRRSVEFLPPYQLAIQTSKLIDTILVDGALSWRHIKSFRLRDRTRSVPTGEGCKLISYKPFLLPERRGASIITKRFNRLRLVHELNRLQRPYHKSSFLFDSFHQLPLLKHLKAYRTGYYMYDDFGVDLNGNSHGDFEPRLEQELMSKSDCVFAVSRKLVESASNHCKKTIYLPNGVNLDVFNSPKPKEDGDRVVIGLCGLISGRVDLVGLLKTALEAPSWKFVIVGGISESLKTELRSSGRREDLWEQITSLPNVEYLSSRPLNQVPLIVREFSVGLIPYCLNQFTLCSSPLKAYEYYALGVPIASTAIPEVLNFDKEVTVIREGESYVESIQKLLASENNSPSITSRILLARSNSTFARASKVVQELCLT